MSVLYHTTVCTLNGVALHNVGQLCVTLPYPYYSCTTWFTYPLLPSTQTEHIISSPPSAKAGSCYLPIDASTHYDITSKKALWNECHFQTAGVSGLVVVESRTSHYTESYVTHRCAPIEYRELHPRGAFSI